ncbi:HVO_0234 family beta-propeller protein [Halococcus saccharolyticus]|uniref:HVO-0234-like beta-propeller domain-containing protein n=1 Tax=Halococcus saccharolyticus DSM 5350 TaxID=1227455 RepID=M0MDN5_9EURY|nr:hypothetical protein [Halococcus saccharolyticus]EMA43856.1 hypothetical protein C449_12490 [Halococcus saccharolyticus DSM 5350]
MSSIDEKRVYGPDSEEVALFVASETGLARVAVVGARIGEIELVDRATAHDLAVHDGRIAVATDEDVVLGTDEDAESTGFGRAAAIGSDGTLLAAAPDGTVARRIDGEWTPVSTVTEPQAIDGELVAAADGVYRCSNTDCQHVGLDAASDVAAAGTPHATTADGLYRLGNGWLPVLDGMFSMMSTDRGTAEPGAIGRAHAATDETLYRHADGEWTTVDDVDREVVDVAYGGAESESEGGVYAVTADGTLLSETDDGWRDHPLGLRGVRALVARPDRKSR